MYLFSVEPKIACLLYVSVFVFATDAYKNANGTLVQNYNPCCSMPCHHRGICTPISSVQYECDCAKGYFGRSCEKGIHKRLSPIPNIFGLNFLVLLISCWNFILFTATVSTWFSSILKISPKTKQKLALTGKLFWAVINNIPALHDCALRYVYLCEYI